MTDDNRNVSIENDWRNLLYTELKRTGGDPSFLFEILEGIIEQRAWETLTDDNGKPVGSLKRLIEAPLPVGVGQDVDKVLKLLDIEHRYESKDKKWKQRMKLLRDAIHEELEIKQREQEENIPAVGEHGGDRRSDEFQEQVSNKKLETRKVKGGTNRAYRISVLKKYAPDLADKVIAKKISANTAYKQLRARQGKETKLRRAINMLDAKSAMDTILKFMPDEVVNELIDLLIQWQESED